MNRCLRSRTPRAHLWRVGVFAALFTLCTLASAQQGVRNFPPTALRGIMQITNPPEMLLDGRVARLSPGARVRGVNNLLVVSGSLIGQALVVNYVRGSMGLVQEVWVLNATEAQQPAPNDVPRTNYLSNFADAPSGAAASAVSPATSYKN